ncbi:unnamed protein product [Adineta steineri]|uniref:Uncharacterized protein n=1 Tax=Adineta steineri TaxID=433720 RepID=A0A813MLH3_9BILA|nr:unnamed protein product [Adineta steineri]
MYFLVLFEPTHKRAIYQNDNLMEKLTVKDLLEWICKQFHFESSTGETGNRRLSLIYNNTELQLHWFLQDVNIRFGATVRCMVKEDRIPDYRLFLPIRNETFDVFDSTLHPTETTVFQLRVVASHKSGLPLSAFRLVTDTHDELFDHVRLSQYDIDYRATLTIQTWIGWSDFFTYAIKGYTKAVLKLVSSDELVRQYMLQVALYISAHYGHQDLARALLQLEARADRPVGHHPSRQWCSTDCAHPEYFRCPIHEAIASLQVNIVTLFGSRDVSILQKNDGYGLKPWRLALRQEVSQKQYDIASFILIKQFDGVRLSNKVTVPQRYVYIFKQWAERAREHVYAQHGLQCSSLKRKPLINHGESLLGYKVLVDGYNNDFQDYYSTAEYAKDKMRTGYVILDERERIRLKNTENYMKNFSVATSLQNRISINTTPIQQTKGITPSITTSNSGGISVGKKLWSKIARLYRLETYLLRNAIDLIESGLITDEIKSNPARHNINTTVSRVSSSISSSSSANSYVPIRIRLFVGQFRLIKEMMYKPDKDGRTLRHLSGVEWAKVRRGQNNAWHTKRASTAVKSKNKQKRNKLNEEKKTKTTQLPDIQRVESSSAKIPLPKERRKIDYRFILRGNDKLHKEIMYDWERAARYTLPSLCVQSLTEASKFQRKSWIRQVNIAMQFATNHSRRTFKTFV